MRSEYQSEREVLSAWLYSWGVWIGTVLVLVGVVLPSLAAVGVVWLGFVPVLSALGVSFKAWNQDRRLSISALLALSGVLCIYFISRAITMA